MGRAGSWYFTVTLLALFIYPLHTASAQLLQKLEQEFIKGAEIARASCVRVDIERKTVRSAIVLEGPKAHLKRTIQEGPISLSGIVMNPEGLVATVGQALEGAYRVWVSHFDGKVTRRFKAEVVGYSLESNVGLLRIKNAEPFEVPALGDSDSVRQGAIVMGIGYAYNQGASPSFSVGIVNATDRVFKLSAPRGSTEVFIQTSLALQPGESGGPMVNSSMEVVGLLLTRYQPVIPLPDGDQANAPQVSSVCTLVMPINKVKKETELILAGREEPATASKGRLDPWLGLRGQEINDDLLRDRLQMPEGGILVSYVFPDDPAYRAGIVENDVLKAWNNTQIMGLDHLKGLIGTSKVGEKVLIRLIRDGKEHRIELLIGSYIR